MSARMFLSFVMIPIILGTFDVQEKYYQYLVQYGKDLSRFSDVDYIARFKKSSDFLEKFEKEGINNGAAFTVELNALADVLVQDAFFEYDDSSFDSPPGDIFLSQLQNTSHRKEFALPPTLNWDTIDNPTGKSVIVGGIRNQGLCGACWAFSAVEGVESSIVIQEGLYVSLSVQQLLDCDRAFNRGCFGGNPVNAYSYIMQNGLNSWDDYPYVEFATKSVGSVPPTDTHTGSSVPAVGAVVGGSPVCLKQQYPSRASIQGYIRIPPMDESTIRQLLHSVGPVSIGICGTDLSFLLYASGIYNDPHCCILQNHALLLVGYGFDEESQLDYWIARNSWGVQWGEQGYIRLKRSSGIWNVRGVGQCGMALNPSVVVGGYTKAYGQTLPSSNNNDRNQQHPINNEPSAFYLLVCGMTVLIVCGGCVCYHCLTSLDAAGTAYDHQKRPAFLWPCEVVAGDIEIVSIYDSLEMSNHPVPDYEEGKQIGGSDSFPRLQTEPQASQEWSGNATNRQSYGSVLDTDV